MTAKNRVAHRFGGVWTEIKLKALTEYLDFYQKALKNQGFETWYIDAFAGTGDRHAELQKGGIFEGRPIEHVEEILDGSARKALKIQPPFNHYWFTEQHLGRANALRALKKEFSLDISVQPGEANVELRALFSSRPWSGGSTAGRQRGVVFLDPYGMSVDWRTLETLAGTKRVDVWYLFPRKAVVQQLAHDLRGVDEAKRQKLAQIFGCDDWEEEFYRSRPIQGGLFDQIPVETKGRIATPEQISAFARKQLENLFCYVSEPIPLIVNGSDFFELYCLSNNRPAIPLIKRGVDHVRRKYTPASRRRFVP
ncbi:three-Cys-motif partner protein TcmP [Sphingomonas sp. Root241]|uniref:three-Cys-motif partner protein TcmP n=1 Tax=Sphingomonas sp. Root241 TaxID=1736501 RepID=UPI000AED0E84|nr:three-Cys-motif partner protein TcmP [Sphingomonas sp. Root241]